MTVSEDSAGDDFPPDAFDEFVALPMARPASAGGFHRRLSGYFPTPTGTLEALPAAQIGRIRKEKLQDCSAVYELHRHHLLGEGGSGKVFAGSCKATGQRVAIKVINIDLKLRDEQTIKEFLSEIEIMNLLKDANHVLKLLDVFETENEIQMVLECCSGDLSKRFHEYMSEAAVCEVFAELVAGLTECQSMGIIHRDIKPENFLFGLDGRLRLSDFGLAVMASETFTTRAAFDEKGSLKGTELFLSPEGYRGRKFSFKSDNWSCGVILYWLLNGARPFTPQELLSEAPLDPSSMRMDGLSENAIHLVCGLLEKDPLKRLSLDDVANHPWMTGKKLETSRSDALLARLRHYGNMSTARKSLMKMAATKLLPSEIASVGHYFRNLDKDNSNTITLRELVEGFEMKGVSKDQLEGLMGQLDLDGNQEIDYDEFVTASVSHTLLLREETLLCAFREFDINGDKKISKSEFVQCMQSFNYNLSEEQIMELVHQFDKDGNGEIDYNEFVAMMVGH